MDDTLDIGQHQYARFSIPQGRVLVHYDPETQRLIVEASEGVCLHAEKASDATLSISANNSST